VPAADEVTLHASGVRLAEVGDALRVVVHSDSPRVTVAVRSSSVSALRVCPVAGPDAAASSSTCVTPTAGSPASVPLAPRYTGVEVARTAPGGASVLEEVAVSYRPLDRAMEIRLPRIVPGGPGSAAVFRLTPAASGSFHAIARWSGPGAQGDAGELTMESGPAANRQSTARAYGSGAAVRGILPQPLETTLTLRAAGDVPLVDPVIAVSWPSG